MGGDHGPYVFGAPAHLVQEYLAQLESEVGPGIGCMDLSVLKPAHSTMFIITSLSTFSLNAAMHLAMIRTHLR
eukprot:4744625-Prorocentrum_lima.AAC.1